MYIFMITLSMIMSFGFITGALLKKTHDYIPFPELCIKIWVYLSLFGFLMAWKTNYSEIFLWMNCIILGWIHHDQIF